MDYWLKYNKEFLTLNNKIEEYNEFNQFNFIEESFYNHVRDILALVIIKCSKNNNLKILDYGSNIMPWVNLKNKINIENLDISIFDPFSQSKIKKINRNTIVSSDLVNFEKKIFDLTIFGSSSQYIKDFYELLITNKGILSKNILFTHTPFSIDNSFESLQFTGFSGKQYVRSIEKLFKFFKERNYKIEFKSIINNKYASVEKKYIDKTIYANILFTKV